MKMRYTDCISVSFRILLVVLLLSVSNSFENLFLFFLIGFEILISGMFSFIFILVAAGLILFFEIGSLER